MDVHAIVTRLRDLSRDPQNRSAIAKDEASLSGLVLCLSNEDPNIVLISLEALKFLAMYTPNRPVMKNHMGMIQSLQTLSANENAEVVRTAEEIHSSLVPSRAAQRTKNVNSPVVKGVPSATGRGAFFLGQGNKNAKVFLIEINGVFSSTDEQSVKTEMLKIRGIISFTYDKMKQRYTIRTRADVTPERIVHQINKIKGISASHIIKNENGEEVAIKYGSDFDQENVPDYPDYLPEEDDDFDGSGKDSDNAYSIQRVRKMGDPNDAGSGGWLGSVGSYISKSLYW